ncbi:MAG TPA: redoxin domain-containing protein [Micromonosporaceae bacterium]|jgi:peroxiredoxin|nr:redoxin domain-containing protein [Micromonosporaceae bacterium]
MRVRLGAISLIVVSALTLVGCGTTSGEQVGSDKAPAVSGTVGYDFTSTTLDGDTFDGQSLKGKPAVLWFWAPWCPTCRGQAPHVNALAKDYAGKATVVGVAGLDTVAAMHEFVETTKLSGFPQLSDEQGEVWKRFGVTEQSTFVLLDASGGVVERGSKDVEALPGRLDKLLAG